MTAAERRQYIITRLKESESPCSASFLAAELGVSRQIIVGDVALLRASGTDIYASARGYVLPGIKEGLMRRIACSHTADQMRDELYCIVDHGCIVQDVIVEHPVYNELCGRLQLGSRYDVDRFIEQCAAAEARPLSMLTEGIHLHTLVCPDEGAFERVRNDLAKRGILLEQNDKIS